MNLLVEDWGGNIQSQDISALKGNGIEELLDKILLEAQNWRVFTIFLISFKVYFLDPFGCHLYSV